MAHAKLGDSLGSFFDGAWYLSSYADVALAGADPLDHFLKHGAAEGRNPNAFFDSAWYLGRYPDVAEAGVLPLLHYLQHGAAELRDPHPSFDAAFYATEHPEAAANPLLHHVLVGARRGYPTEKHVALADCLPSESIVPTAPPGLVAHVVIPVYRGLAQTRRCIESVLADPLRPAGQVIVIDDRTPEPALAAWLDAAAAKGRIRLIRNRRNHGFVISANRGIAAAGQADVVLLNSDTEVPPGWLARLAGHAYAARRVASVSPFSNNATICSYPSEMGGPMPAGVSLAEMDALCQRVNAGRSVQVPTTVGFCMYIRRACLDEIGAFDAETFGRGYGEENDFCMRAASRGWENRLGCDVFVYHEGSVSFGVASADLDGKADLLVERHPTYFEAIAAHLRRDEVGPFRFALTAALFRQASRPVVLLVSHGLGGGVAHHMDALVASVADQAHFLLLSAAPRGVALSVPGRPDHPVLHFAADRLDDIARLLRSAGVSRVHIHHLLRLSLDVRGLVARLGVPFDFTAHDYFAICPQINLLPQRDGPYCGEPEPAVCNACIANRSEFGASDILTWRAEHRWLLREADRVICPSEDARRRLTRYGLDERGIVVPHEAVPRGPWPVRLPAVIAAAPARAAAGGRRLLPLRVAMLGVLTSHKGSRTVAAVAETADPAAVELILIGYAEVDLPPLAAARIRQTGEYKAGELRRLIGRVRPHLIWFPGQVPETYSYTLTAAIDSGLPIVAADIGALPERLAGRPYTWFADPGAPAETWIARFEVARTAMARAPATPRAKPRPPVPDYYRAAYAARLRPPNVAGPAIVRGGPIDLRQPDRTTILAVAERLTDGSLSPCAYIRLLQPIDHLAAAGGVEMVLASPEEALRYRADVLASQRFAVTMPAMVDRLAAHCQTQRMRFLFDLDDDLINIPPEHPEADRLGRLGPVVAAMVAQAHTVWVSTAPLAASLSSIRRDVRIVPNGLDERIWSATPPPGRLPFGPVRILFMGTATHDADLELVLPALERLTKEFGNRVRVDVLGITGGRLPAGINRVAPPPRAAASYPAFVGWLSAQHAWDVGIAPLVDRPFNRCKSAIKTMDYAALGLAVLASDVEPYRGSIADGQSRGIADGGGWLVAESGDAWFAALARIVQDWRLLARLQDDARRGFLEHTLAFQAAARRRAWAELIAPPRRSAAA